jgi:hypothetical protein
MFYIYIYILYTKPDDGWWKWPKHIAVLNKIKVLCLMVDIVIYPLSTHITV